MEVAEEAALPLLKGSELSFKDEFITISKLCGPAMIQLQVPQLFSHLCFQLVLSFTAALQVLPAGRNYEQPGENVLLVTAATSGANTLIPSAAELCWPHWCRRAGRLRHCCHHLQPALVWKRDIHFHFCTLHSMSHTCSACQVLHPGRVLGAGHAQQPGVWCK